MGKRTRNTSDDFESIAEKIKKLEQKLKRVRRRDRRSQRKRLSSSSTSTTSSCSSSSCSRSVTPNANIQSLPELPNIEGAPTEPTNFTLRADCPQPSISFAPVDPLHTFKAVPVEPLPSTSAAVAQSILAPTNGLAGQSELVNEDPTPGLNDELLQILGEGPSQTKVYGKEIQQDLAVRLQHICTTGLSKEARKELLERYLPPANCVLIDATGLNPEAAYAISEAVLKRDKGIELRQKQRASAATCVAEALTLLMSSDPKNTALIKLLMDASKLICDGQATDSMVRRNFRLNGLKKELKDQLQATQIDKLLFGEKLADTLKAAKAISRSGADMKTAPSRPSTSRNPPQNLNWRAPPLRQRPKGFQRKQPHTHKNQPANSSKRSSRPTQDRSRKHR